MGDSETNYPNDNTPTPTKNCNFWTIFSATGIVAGFLSFIVFFILRNYEAGIWGFASFLVASMLFYLNYLDLRKKIPEKYDIKDIEDMQGLAITFSVVGLAGTLWYIFKYFYYHIPILPVEHSVVIAMVWSFMTMKWSLQLIYDTYYYRHRMLNNQLLPN